MATNYQVPEAYNQYLKQMQDELLSKAETMEYNPASPSALKSAIAKAIRPDYDKAIQSQQKSAAKNRAAIDADAAARGMGSSSWVTDVKNRQNDAAAANIAGIEGDYMATLYGTLLDRLGQQEANKLSVDQFNATARQNALAQALSQTDKWWQTWEAQQKKKGGSGSSHQWQTFVSRDGDGTTDDMYKYTGSNLDALKNALGLKDAKTNIKDGHLVDKNGNRIFL